MDLNRAEIIGRLTRDPETRQTPSGQSVTTMGAATNFTWKDQGGQKQEKTEFHNIVAWGKLAELCAQYLKKGSRVYFAGRLQTRNWEDDSGNKHYRTEIIADNMIMLDTRSSSASQSSNSFTDQAPVLSKEDPLNSENISTVETQEDSIKIEEVPF